ncbi:carbohydrate-binding protein [Asticcacaulis solisilvae]|uniref:carbohydrate-binding protein n=1 Tax=Asticcacaulis solisilvae TaxID=1217274 RepID=UPI003FD84FD8
MVDNVEILASYSTLRSYAGTPNVVAISAKGIAGTFYRDTADTTSSDNGGTVIVAGTVRWKRIFNGAYDVRWWGAACDGSTDDYTALVNCIDAVDALGGGKIFIPGTLRHTQKLIIGNGAGTTQSTKHHRITFTGLGSGLGADFTNVENNGPSRLLYDPASVVSDYAWEFRGPLHNLFFEAIDFDCNLKSYGQNWIHVCVGGTANCTIRNYLTVALNGTTRSDFGSGYVYGSASVVHDHLVISRANDFNCTGVTLTSGVTGDPSGKPDCARWVFRECEISYGGGAGYHGFQFIGADNCQIYGGLCNPMFQSLTNRGAWATATSYAVNDKVLVNGAFYKCLTAHLSGTFATDLSAGKWQILGYDVYLSPWPGTPSFPKEIWVAGTGMTRGAMAGSGWTGTATFSPFQTDDGAPVPAFAGAVVQTHSGLRYQDGVRLYSANVAAPYETASDTSVTSSSYADLGSYAVTITSPKAGFVDAQFTGLASMFGTGGTGSVLLSIDGADDLNSEQRLVPDGNFHGVSASWRFSVAAGSHTVKVRAKGDGTNALHVAKGSLNATAWA